MSTKAPSPYPLAPSNPGPTGGFVPSAGALEDLAPELVPIREKVLAGERLSMDDGRTLFASADLNGVGALANGGRWHPVHVTRARNMTPGSSSTSVT